ncbi:hypothetical protein JW905_18940 [bacterium]|nr:hypothetical protein [candidate division CSSED10-310 bacterium]
MHDRSPMPGCRKKVTAFLFSTVMLVALVTAINLFFSLAGYNAPTLHRHRENVFGYDLFGYTLRPGAVDANEQGYREGKPTILPPHRSFQLGLMFGDSMVYGWGVPEPACLPSVIERLSAGRGDVLEIINLGVPATSQFHHLLRCRNEADVIEKSSFSIICICPNDPLEDSKLDLAIQAREKTPALFRTMMEIRTKSATWWWLSERISILTCLHMRELERARQEQQAIEERLLAAPYEVLAAPFETNLRTLIHILRDDFSHQLMAVVTVTWPFIDRDRTALFPYESGFRDAVFNLLDEEGVAVVDVMHDCFAPLLASTTAPTPADLFMDQLHYTELGYDVVGNRCAELLAHTRFPDQEGF